MMHRHVPARCPAERKATDDQTILIDGIMLADMLQRLERIGLARKFVAVAIATVAVQHEGVCRRELAG